MAILLLVSWPRLQLVVIGRAHSLGIARPNQLFSQFLSVSREFQRKKYKCHSIVDINKYGSNLDPRTMEQGEFLEIEVSNSISDLAYETSNSASRAHSNSSDSEASTGVRNELASSSSQDLSENFYDISRFFQGKID